jgi:hypothetical protein
MDTSQNKLFDTEFYYTSSPKHHASSNNKSKIDDILFSSENNSKTRLNFSNSVIYNNNNNSNNNSNSVLDIKDNNNPENHLFLQLYAATQLLTYFHSANLHAALNSQLYNNPSYIPQHLNKTCCINSVTKDSSNDSSLISTENIASSLTSFDNSPNSSSLSVGNQAQSMRPKGKINFASISDLIN